MTQNPDAARSRTSTSIHCSQLPAAYFSPPIGYRKMRSLILPPVLRQRVLTRCTDSPLAMMFWLPATDIGLSAHSIDRASSQHSQNEARFHEEAPHGSHLPIQVSVDGSVVWYSVVVCRPPLRVLSPRFRLEVLSFDDTRLHEFL